MRNSATDLLAVDGATRAIDASAAPTTSSGVMALPSGFGRQVARWWSRLSDLQVALVVSSVLFVVAAWPLLLTEVPPFQDLPNHLAAVTIIQHQDRYPEFVFNGFFKTNAALFAFLYVVGKVTGVNMAARLFTAIVLAINALVLPRFVLELTGSRRRMIVASLFAWPMVHNWFVSMGMLDFALGVALSLVLLLMLQRQRVRPSLLNAGLISVVGVVTWYAHVFPLLLVHVLVAVEVARDLFTKKSWKDRLAGARAMCVPLAPITVLVLVSLYQHAADHVGPMTGFIDAKKELAPWELVYNLWAEWFWSFSKLTLSTMVPCVLLALFGFLRRKEAPPFFSPPAVVVLVLMFVFSPYIVTNWFHVNSRVIPFIWFACLLRVPERLPGRLGRSLAALLGLSAVLYSAGQGVDYVRLERERQEFIAGVEAVPEGARLLPLLFRHKEISENTRNILHAWGYYVVERQTSAPLLFAHSHSFPVMYSSPPPVRFNHLVLEGFASAMAHPSAVCRSMLDGNVVVDDCEAAYRATWKEFWSDATPRYDHLLVWDPTPEAIATFPSDYKMVFERGRLQIWGRGPLPGDSAKTHADVDAPSGVGEEGSTLAVDEAAAGADGEAISVQPVVRRVLAD